LEFYQYSHAPFYGMLKVIILSPVFLHLLSFGPIFVKMIMMFSESPGVCLCDYNLVRKVVESRPIKSRVIGVKG